MKNHIIWTIASIVISINTSIAQNSLSDYTYVDSVILLKHLESKSYSTNIVSTQYGRNVVFTYYNRKYDIDTITIYNLNVDTYKLESTRIVRPGISRQLEELQSYEFKSIACNDTMLFLSFYEHVLVYDKQNDSTYRFEKEIYVPEAFRHIILLSDSTLLFSNNYVETRLTKQRVSIFLMNTNTGKIYKKLYPHYNTSLISCFNPFKYIDNKDDIILFANRNEYSFLFYNNNLDIIDSIGYADYENWVTIPDKVKKKALKKGPQPVDIMEYIRKHFYSATKLNFIYMPDTNNIIAVITSKREESTFYNSVDTWKKADGKWVRNLSDISEYKYNKLTEQEQTEPLKPNGLDVNFFNGKTHFFDDKIVKLDVQGVGINPIGITRLEYWNKHEEWLSTKAPHFRIIVFNHSLLK